MKSMEEKFNKKLPFKVPEGYFDNLPLRVQERIAATETQHEPKSRWVTLKSQLAFAAGFAFMALLSYLGYYMARPLMADKKAVKTDYVEIVSRTIYEFDDIDLYKAIEQKKKTDSLKEVYNEIPHRLYVRSSNCITIIDEKKEIKP
ncbi:MAG: hypothetical protein WBJ36_11360 [Tenuifilum sp.]|nr:hypothetical protein [Tenuifilum sp.]HON70849.1 hypothetical protein [Tenuifilum sp.]HOU74592.1 hypothetical protein [Tenuifilum sp.]HPP90365.1 hypothetical protein [Tenuifilum sp.]HQE54618.1 hypothetical protein [Tenuifilum sp.]